MQVAGEHVLQSCTVPDSWQGPTPTSGAAWPCPKTSECYSQQRPGAGCANACPLRNFDSRQIGHHRAQYNPSRPTSRKSALPG